MKKSGRRSQDVLSKHSQSVQQIGSEPRTSAFAGTEQHRLSQLRWSAKEFARILLRSSTATTGLIVCLVVAFLAICAPLIAPYEPNRQDLPAKFMAPSAMHPLGTDEYGRDLLSRIIWGSRISLRVGILSVSIAVGIGVPLGLLAGYLGGNTENLIMRVTDMLLAFPLMLLCMALVAFLGFSLSNVTVAIGVALTPTYIRLVRSSVLSVKQREFIQAALALGATDIRIMIRHLLPNVLAPIIVMSTLNVAWAILVEGALSFLGMGVPPPTATWGSIVGEGRRYVQNAPWISSFGGLAITITVLGLNLFGDGLRDALDPTMRRQATV